MQICYFGDFEHFWPRQSKMIVSTYGKLCCSSACKKSTSFLTSFLRYHKDTANLSGYFEHTWPNSSKRIVSTCPKLWCLLASTSLPGSEEREGTVFGTKRQVSNWMSHRVRWNWFSICYKVGWLYVSML